MIAIDDVSRQGLWEMESGVSGKGYRMAELAELVGTPARDRDRY